jgi:hypothetical protein
MSRSHVKQKPMRNSAMEVLWFMETPSVSYVDTHSPAPSRLVSTSTKGGQSVAEMWETTELHADSMADWKPVDVDKRRLNKRVRWPLVTLWIVILAVAGAGGYFIWQAPTNGAEAALNAVSVDGMGLQEVLGPLETANASLIPGQSIDATSISTAVNDVDNASRALFSSAGALPASESASRTAASDAATQALDASKTLNGLAAYLGAVTPVMVAPTLITDPELIDLETAVREYGSWRSHFDSVRAALPEGTMSRATQELSLVSNRLESIQNAYIDGLREDNRQAALAAVRELEGLLSTAWGVLLQEAETAQTAVAARIESAWDSLGLLG